MPGRKPTISNELFHQLLWENVDRRQCLNLSQKAWVEALGVNKFAICRAVRRLVDEGRIRHITNSSRLSGTFWVANPDEWQLLPKEPVSDEQ